MGLLQTVNKADLLWENGNIERAYAASMETKQTVSKAGATLKLHLKTMLKHKVNIKYKQVKDEESFLPSSTYKEGNVRAL